MSGRWAAVLIAKGPADFCVVPMAEAYLVVVPDLVKSEFRMIRLAK